MSNFYYYELLTLCLTSLLYLTPLAFFFLLAWFLKQKTIYYKQLLKEIERLVSLAEAAQNRSVPKD